MKWLICLYLTVSSAFAFQIQTAVSEPCHEKITLAAFGAIDGAFLGDVAAEDALAALVARARGEDVPRDKATRGFVKDAAKRFGFADRGPHAQWVIASLVAGARQPDTRGFAIVAFNEARVTHIDDKFQAPHSLRKSGDDGVEGNEGAIAGARDLLVEILGTAHETWWRQGGAVVDARWSFPFYGEQTIRVFGPAFHLGEMAHTTQDAFTHTLRDEALNIVSVLNFVDAAGGDIKESRDGLNHSDRLDECAIKSDDFDRLRVTAARDATVDLVRASMVAFMSEDTPDSTAIDPVLDRIYAYRPGCDVSNDYCGSSWLEPARSQLTEPISVWFCATSPNDSSPVWYWIVMLIGWRWRCRRYTR